VGKVCRKRKKCDGRKGQAGRYATAKGEAWRKLHKKECFKKRKRGIKGQLWVRLSGAKTRKERAHVPFLKQKGTEMWQGKIVVNVN